MTDPTNELPLGHDPEEMKKTGRIFCRAFAAFVYAKDKCAKCEYNRTAQRDDATPKNLHSALL